MFEKACSFSLGTSFDPALCSLSRPGARSAAITAPPLACNRSELRSALKLKCEAPARSEIVGLAAAQLPADSQSNFNQPPASFLDVHSHGNWEICKAAIHCLRCFAAGSPSFPFAAEIAQPSPETWPRCCQHIRFTT